MERFVTRDWHQFYGELHIFEWFRDEYGGINFGTTLCGQPLPVTENNRIVENPPRCEACYRLDLMQELSQ